VVHRGNDKGGKRRVGGEGEDSINLSENKKKRRGVWCRGQVSFPVFGSIWRRDRRERTIMSKDREEDRSSVKGKKGRKEKKRERKGGEGKLFLQKGRVQRKPRRPDLD